MPALKNCLPPPRFPPLPGITKMASAESGPRQAQYHDPMPRQVGKGFTIHFSHAHEDTNDRIVCYTSGWPPANTTEFLGAWGGEAPDFSCIPPARLWRTELDLRTGTCISHAVVKGLENCCIEHPHVHPAYYSSAHPDPDSATTLSPPAPSPPRLVHMSLGDCIRGCTSPPQVCPHAAQAEGSFKDRF